MNTVRTMASDCVAPSLRENPAAAQGKTPLANNTARSDLAPPFHPSNKDTYWLLMTSFLGYVAVLLIFEFLSKGAKGSIWQLSLVPCFHKTLIGHR